MTLSSARLPSVITRIRRLPKEQQLLGVVLIVFLAAAFARAWAFYWFPGLPALYAKDLGVNYITAEYIRGNIHSPRDFFDMLGWSVWWDQPMFLLNGYVSYAIIVPLDFLFRNTWSSIKFLEIAQTTTACFGTFWLLRLFGRPKVWALAAGVLFAAVPIIALIPRGNLDLGWPVTFSPLCLALGVAAIRRYGAAALPVIGALCSLIGLCAALEYGLFVSMPLYVALAAYALRLRRNTLSWTCAALSGLIALVALASYFLVPTFTTHIGTDSAARSGFLTDESFAPYFSQDIIACLGLIQTEFLRSPNPLYNATPQVPYSLIGGVLLWTFAIVGFLRRRSAIFGSPFGITCFVLWLALIGMSVSALAPGGEALWHFFGSVPVLRAIRTPDRYFTLAVLPVVILALEGIRACAEDAPSQKSIGAIAVGISLLSFAYVDVSQQFWGNQQDYGYEEPALEQVNATVAAIGPRTVSFAILHDGSKEDYPAYGVPTPTFSATWDIASRYFADPNAGIGVMRRDRARSIITTPPWEFPPDPDFPDLERAFSASPYAKRVLHQSGVSVFALKDADAPVAATNVVCLDSPGLLDNALSLEIFRHDDFSEPASPCAEYLSTNPDPLDVLARLPGALSGTRLCPECTKLVDADDQFYPGPLVLNDPWFRAAIDGASPIFDGRGAVQLDDGSAIEIPRTLLHAGERLAVRLANHTYSTLAVVADGDVATFDLKPFSGFRWFEITLPHRIIHHVRLVAHIDAIVPSEAVSPWHGLALDGVAYDNGERSVVRSPVAITFSPSNSNLSTSAAFDIVGLRYTKDRKGASLTWMGATTKHLVLAISGFFNRGDALRAASGVSSQVLEITKTNAEAGTAIFVLPVDRGGVVSIAVRGSAHSSLSYVLAAPQSGDLALQPRTRKLDAADIDFSYPLGSFAHLSSSGSSPFFVTDDMGIDGTRGTNVETTIELPAGKNEIGVGFWQLGGEGSIRSSLSCGGKRVSKIEKAYSLNNITINAHAARECLLNLTWLGHASLARVFVLDTRNIVYSRSVVLPQGSYRILPFDYALRPLAPSSIRVSANRKDVSFTSGAGASAASMVLILSNGKSGAGNPAAISFRKTSAIRYALRVMHRTDVKIDHLDDGNWMLDGASGKRPGIRCDLVATCFFDVAPGSYHIYHRLPAATIAGFAGSGATITSVILLLAILERRRRGTGRA